MAMKDYDHVIVWINYFNQKLTRSDGRRLKQEQCISDPSLNELIDAAKSAGFEIASHNDKARYPKKPHIRSGYIMLPKTAIKTKILDKISKELLVKRAKRS
jgi:signal recognition particle subunit SRP19